MTELSAEQQAALEPFFEGLGYYERQTDPRFLKLKLKHLITENDIVRLVEAFKPDYQSPETIADHQRA